MSTEEYSVGYEAGYQDGWNACVDSTQPAQEVPRLSDGEIRVAFDKADEGQEEPEFALAFARAIEAALIAKMQGGK